MDLIWWPSSTSSQSRCSEVSARQPARQLAFLYSVRRSGSSSSSSSGGGGGSDCLLKGIRPLPRTADRIAALSLNRYLLVDRRTGRHRSTDVRFFRVNLNLSLAQTQPPWLVVDLLDNKTRTTGCRPLVVSGRSGFVVGYMRLVVYVCCTTTSHQIQLSAVWAQPNIGGSYQSREPGSRETNCPCTGAFIPIRSGRSLYPVYTIQQTSSKRSANFQQTSSN